MSPYREMKLMAEASESNRLETQAKLDRVTAECDALQRRLTESHQRESQLQGMVTAADERLDGAVTLLEVWRTWLGPTRESCDETGKKVWDRIDAVTAPKPAEGSKPSTCTWSEGGFSWHTGCGKEWQFTDGGLPAENGMHFCHSCGKTLFVERVEGGGDEAV